MKTVFRTAEVLALHGRGAVRHAIACGRWQSPHRGVVVVHSGPLSPAEHELVALAICAPASALGGLSALRHDKLVGFAPETTVVVLPEGADRPDGVPFTTHWSTDLGSADVHPNREPRRTRPARSLIDAASWCGSDRYARTIVLAGLQQGLVNVAGMHEALDRRGMCHRRGLIRESVLDAGGGIQSLPERNFDDIRIRAGLPMPTRQRRVKGTDGRYHLDVSWDDLDLAVEVHGTQHQEVGQWDADIVRGNEIVIAGRRLLIFTSYAIRHHPDLVVRQLRHMFSSLGWRAA
ncbi:hypothetical protein [Aeromicrobium fastidiosum]|uniref:DUF559 domain-containing protein n=1 Tax=Aeromicrobium fastidiosum TaxID=52699 RepID=A0A641ALU2_9ACTN|nr:hypothetical protein [Aeromicrobium fastidiosum]KAA1378083.1 hypothetical protein ESP62_006765 [Aeromicrobium fastidiosum]MBP2389122.1 very-short-patch-repair endonuclease [Aeromicrobium fastidiosum]